MADTLPSLARLRFRVAVLLVQIGYVLLAAQHAERISARVAYRIVEIARAIAPAEGVVEVAPSLVDEARESIETA